MVRIRLHPRFLKLYHRIKDKSIRRAVRKQLKKISENPEVGKPMSLSRKGTREVYITPYRMSYSYVKQSDMIIVLDLYHKNHQ
jgi:mRNA-degrading endonuclease RelE of RelBE toxin-antitoxin system